MHKQHHLLTPYGCGRHYNDLRVCMTYIEKSRCVLELPGILAMLAESAESREAKEWAVHVVPQTDIETPPEAEEPYTQSPSCFISRIAAVRLVTRAMAV